GPQARARRRRDGPHDRDLVEARAEVVRGPQLAPRVGGDPGGQEVAPAREGARADLLVDPPDELGVADLEGLVGELGDLELELDLVRRGEAWARDREQRAEHERGRAPAHGASSFARAPAASAVRAEGRPRPRRAVRAPTATTPSSTRVATPRTSHSQPIPSASASASATAAAGSTGGAGAAATSSSAVARSRLAAPVSASWWPPARRSPGSWSAAATSPCAPATSGPTAASPAPRLPTSCSPGSKPRAVNVRTRPTTAVAGSTSISGSTTARASSPSCDVASSTAEVFSSSDPDPAVKLTGVKVSLFALTTPWPPKVMTPHVTRRQSTVSVPPERPVVSKVAPGTVIVTVHSPDSLMVVCASREVDEPGKATKRWKPALSADSLSG